MEILCPNCQNKLTILEQYAGQMMKCPLCAGTFTAPALPPAVGATPSPTPPPAPPASTAPAVPDTMAPPAQTSPPGAPPLEPTLTDHTGKMSLWISPQIILYFPAGLLFLVFVLTFFPWVGIRPGGVWLDSQSAWQVLGGSPSSPDKGTEQLSWFKGKQREKVPLPQPLAGEAERPGFGVIAFFYLLLLMFNFVVAAAAAAAPYFQASLPPAVQPYLGWRWAAAGGVTLVAFAALLLQDSIGFALERRANDAVTKVTKKNEEDWTKWQKQGTFPDVDPKEIPVMVSIFRGTYQQAIVRTFWYRCAFWFHFLALVFVVATMLAELRGQRPPPRVDVVW